ncbi:F-box/LRR-repeat protein 18 [Spea bombifrons]|uniref:F-box/LRR-repeat protein 18 n=1 Tax=Spea bombifrons TaxID=233779 RepID=UPI00234A99D8|nr:F-box/LRR-repeat protein 18 [Spea bombifrons]
MSNSIEEVQSVEDRERPFTINPIELSDEILLHILSYVPSTDLILNVKKTCRKLASLCVDKSLTHRVNFNKVYQARDEQVKQMLKEVGKEICELDVSGCYWLSTPTVDRVAQCKKLVRLDMSGCSLTSLRLSKLLSNLLHLRSLAIDVSSGFDAGQLSSESKATLSRLRELKQTLFAPSYGVVPCCTSLEKLLLYFEVLDRTREGTVMSGQLMVGESNIPHYQNLRLFYARLAPGYVNEEVVRLYLAVLSDRTPENLRAFLISAPGSFPESRATNNLLHSMAKNVSLEAFQLPKSWLNGSSLLQQMKFSSPSYFSFSRCMISGGQLTQRLLNGGKDCKSLVSLNLRGCPFCFSSDMPFRKPEDDIDDSILDTLVAACPNLAHLNFTSAHHHSSENNGRHLCEILARLLYLRSLALPVCAIADTVRTAHNSTSQSTESHVPSPASLGFGKKVRIGVQTYLRNPFDQDSASRSVFWRLLKHKPVLEHLELIGSNFYSAMPRNDPAIRNTYPPCKRSHSVGDSEVAAISQLTFLQNLVLAQVPGILTGSSLVSIGMKCQQLRSLSLANLGMMGKVVYISSLCEMLKYCRQLRDLRLEQPYFSANAQFFQALRHCLSLQRLCIVSRNGTFEVDAMMSFISECCELIMCHMFTGESLTSCKSLQHNIIQSFQGQRPALNVVIFPLLHESLADVIRDVPMMHLDEITLFKSRVAEEPPKLW